MTREGVDLPGVGGVVKAVVGKEGESAVELVLGECVLLAFRCQGGNQVFLGHMQPLEGEAYLDAVFPGGRVRTALEVQAVPVLGALFVDVEGR